MSASEAPSLAPAVGSVLGRHLLVRVLGEGGMGTVFEATHQELGRRAAVKTLHARLAGSADVRARFVREGQAASRVRHPNVVDVYDVGVDGGNPYLVMELLEGEDLSRFLTREGPLAPERAADLLLPVVAAVAAAHELDVVHRDLKPENIFLSAERAGITPKVLDFGISKLVNREEVDPLTSTGAFLGTPHYMSPEQAQGSKDVDARSDQYSLGVILYQATTGRRPVEETSIYALIQRIVRGQFPPPRSLNPDLSAAFEALVLRAMAREPSQRFVSTRELGLALLPFASARVRTLYGPELAPAADVPAPPSPEVASGEPSPFGTTLGDSVQQRAVPSPSGATRRSYAALMVLLAAVVLGLVWRGVSRPPRVPAAPAGATEPEPAQPLSDPNLAPRAAPNTSRVVGAAPSASSSAAPSASAAASVAGPAPAKAAKPKTAPRDVRPQLAPR